MNKDRNEAMVTVKDVYKSYKEGEVGTAVLQGASLTVMRQAFTSIVGASGSGKSTLLSLIGGLDRPDSGAILVAGQDITRLSARELTQYRRTQLGIIFQLFNLLPTLTSCENVELGLEFSPLTRRERTRRALHYLERVGLAEMARKYPAQLSGGEQQRVAIARALARAPTLILADEPTGNLDHATGNRIFALIRELQRGENLTCLMVTHNLELATQTDQVVRLCDGRVSG